MCNLNHILFVTLTFNGVIPPVGALCKFVRLTFLGQILIFFFFFFFFSENMNMYLSLGYFGLYILGPNMTIFMGFIFTKKCITFRF